MQPKDKAREGEVVSSAVHVQNITPFISSGSLVQVSITMIPTYHPCTVNKSRFLDPSSSPPGEVCVEFGPADLWSTVSMQSFWDIGVKLLRTAAANQSLGPFAGGSTGQLMGHRRDY